MKIAALLLAAAFGVGAVSGCGGGTQAPHAMSVAEVKQAFADAGLRLSPVDTASPAPPAGVPRDANKAARRAAEQTEADLTWGPPGTDVTIFRTARYAAQVAKEIGGQLPRNVRLKRISNVLVTWWVGAEVPALRAAIRHLS
jgi:hypothetical protein